MSVTPVTHGLVTGVKFFKSSPIYHTIDLCHIHGPNCVVHATGGK